MEFFIARKVRPVFEVYRQVFHKTMEVAKKIEPQPQLQKPSLSIEDQVKLTSMVCKETGAGRAEKRAALNNLLLNGLPQISFATQNNSGAHALPAEDLISMHGLSISSKAFYNLMKEHGYAENGQVKTRHTRSGFATFSMLTDEGGKWGFNAPNQRKAGAFSIRLYVKSFPELSRELGLMP